VIWLRDVPVRFCGGRTPSIDRRFGNVPAIVGPNGEMLIYPPPAGMNVPVPVQGLGPLGRFGVDTPGTCVSPAVDHVSTP
jgi:hypothetical protein